MKKTCKIQVEPCGKAEEEWVAGVMLAAYQEICSKAGLKFPGAEEDIKGIASLAESVEYGTPGFELRISPRASFGRPNFYFRRAEEELAEIPYNPADALTYMQSVGGEEVRYSRKVTGDTAYLFRWIKIGYRQKLRCSRMKRNRLPFNSERLQHLVSRKTFRYLKPYFMRRTGLKYCW